jgi:phosphatidylcholine synthase
MTIQLKALCVHLFTATGAVFAMLALLAAVEEKWPMMFLWLVVAFIVDGIDGPLARHYDVSTNAPQYDGGLMDLIIDYLTYVFIPAYALFKSGLLPGWTGWIAIIVITFASVVYFADTRMKTKDNSFWGFPGCWNMVVIVLFALQPNFWAILLIVCVLAAAMFAPGGSNQRLYGVNATKMTTKDQHAAFRCTAARSWRAATVGSSGVIGSTSRW